MTMPIACASCGGPCSPADDGALCCAYCGAHDRLPADQLERLVEVRRRLAAVVAAVMQLTAVERALAHLFERRRASWRVSAPWLAIAVIVLGTSIAGSWRVLATMPAAARAAQLLQSVAGVGAIAGVPIALWIALAVGRRAYRQDIRPQLTARAPRELGLPARCRGCGADLPAGRDALINCAYCVTVSLVTPELARDRVRLLDAERAHHRDHGQRAVAATTRTAARMTRAMIVAIVVSYSVSIAGAVLASR